MVTILAFAVVGSLVWKMTGLQVIVPNGFKRTRKFIFNECISNCYAFIKFRRIAGIGKGTLFVTRFSYVFIHLRRKKHFPFFVGKISLKDSLDEGRFRGDIRIALVPFSR